MGMLYLGHLQVKKVSKAQENQHHMQLKSQQMMYELKLETLWGYPYMAWSDMCDGPGPGDCVIMKWPNGSASIEVFPEMPSDALALEGGVLVELRLHLLERRQLERPRSAERFATQYRLRGRLW